MKLLQWIISLFAARSHQNDLNNFIASRHPTNTVEVEHLIRMYDQQQKRWPI